MSEETVDHPESTQKKRPTLLMVLCILTWVVSAYYVLTVPFEYFFSSEMDPETFQSTINDTMSEMADQDPEVAKMMEKFMKAASQTVSKSIENAGWIAAGEIIVALLSALGAFMMFNLRKIGFWIYVVAKILGILSVLLFMGTNVLTASLASFALFVSLIMVVLYAVNLKRMH